MPGVEMARMQDDLYDSPTQTLTIPAPAPLVPPPSSQPPAFAPAPPVALEYQPPQPRRGRGDMGWGILISVFLAKGVGWFIFGALMMMGYRDDHAGPVAVGAGFFVLGAGIAGALAWTRRQQQQQPQHPR
jgi:hypothetical protein